MAESVLMRDFVDIKDIGKIYSTYRDFFSEQEVSEEGFKMSWDPTWDNSYNSDNRKVIYDWLVVKKGFHRNSEIDRQPMFILEKTIDGVYHKIIIGIDGICNFRPSRKFKEELNFNNVWD